MEQQMELIRKLMYEAIVGQLNTPYPSLGYYGEPKRGNSPRKASGNLIKSLVVKWEVDFNADPSAPEPLLVVEMDDYYYWVDQGRKPSFKYPPLKDIEKWTRQKPLGRFRDKKGRFIDNESRTFLVARSIKEKGFQGINFLSKAEAEVTNQLVNLGEEAAAQFFTKLIDDGLVVALSKQK